MVLNQAEGVSGCPVGCYGHPEDVSGYGVLVVHPSGIQVKAQEKISVKDVPPASVSGRKILGRSKRSRKRLMRHLISIDLSGLSSERKDAKYARLIFITLTYPFYDGLPFQDSVVAKSQLKAFEKRLERRWGLSWCVWVQEYQKSGAIHFHLVCLLPSVVSLSVFRSWLSLAWYEVVASGNIAHYRAGTSAIAVYAKSGKVSSLLSYLSKEVSSISKGQHFAVDSQGEVLESGKTWGVFHREVFDSFKVIISKLVFRSWEGWEQFKLNVSEKFSRSWYLSRAFSMSFWSGGLLYGSGILADLLKDCEGYVYV